MRKIKDYSPLKGTDEKEILVSDFIKKDVKNENK